MPLLMCPNDSSAMQTMERSGVQFDMCPSCRGVWLDRGELEKLMEAAAADGRAAAPAPQQTYAPPLPAATAAVTSLGGAADRPIATITGATTVIATTIAATTRRRSATASSTSSTEA
jgi:Zn-finger nucleic acid-binding protein